MYEENNLSNETEQKKNIFVSLKTIIALCILSGLIGGGIFLAGYSFIKSKPENSLVLGNTSKPTDNDTDKSTKQITNIKVDSVNSPANAVAKKVLPSIVGISVTTKVVNESWFGNTETEQVGEGSGIIYSEDGYIITNYHVVQDAITSAGEKNPKSRIRVFLYNDPETGIEADVIGYDISSDLAVIKISKTNLTPIEIGNSDELEVGNIVIALGNPGGLQFMGSVSQGIISGLNRVIEMEGTYENLTLIQTDAAINPGNSGGALVDINGRLIGVNSVKLAATGYEGMGFAIPVKDVKRITDDLIVNGNAQAVYLGITEDTRYTSELLQKNGYPAGIVVKEVVSGSPAKLAGIEAYDIITSFNGQKVTSMKELVSLKNKCKKGDKVTIKVYRQQNRFYGDYLDIEVTLA